MKYIRTKNGKILDLDTMEFDWAFPRENFVKAHAVKQADTIEELCDEFVDIDNYDYYKIVHKNGITYALSKTKRFIGHCDIRLKYIGQIMGAIYTNKVIIYVAKMNEKGELELL